jgi:hypothetical protein
MLYLAYPMNSDTLAERRDQSFETGKLWSLLDMLRMNAVYFIALGGLSRQASTVFDLAKNDLSNPFATAEESKNISFLIESMRQTCERINLPVALKLLEHAESSLPETRREFELLLRVLNAELEAQVFLFIPSHKSGYFEKENTLTDEAKLNFPNSNQEIIAAGNAFSSDLNTACVFHCVRALEYGIGALARDLQVAFNIQNWQTILDEIERAIAIERKAGKSAAKNVRLQFLSEAVAEFRHFKDGWRNYVSHNKINYTETQALKIMEHTTSFIEALSAQLKE